jgi:hypothetical protein
MNPSHPIADAPGIEGPDYVALVIEWGDLEDVSELGDIDDAVTLVNTASRSRERPRMIVTVVGALGVLALAMWGLHRLTA